MFDEIGVGAFADSMGPNSSDDRFDAVGAVGVFGAGLEAHDLVDTLGAAGDQRDDSGVDLVYALADLFEAVELPVSVIALLVIRS